MQTVEIVRAFEQIKCLADSRRLRLLRLLMNAPDSLTGLARSLGRSPAWIRHHIQKLQAAGLVERVEQRRAGRTTEKLYRARAGALLLQEAILPHSRKPIVLFSGSHDLALENIAARLSRHVTVLSLPVGSLDGLVNLRQGLCQLAGAHILDAGGEYNLPTVRHLFPDREMEVVTLAHRTQGLMFAASNPKSIRGLTDLPRADVRFVNRNAGSGTRLWLDAQLKRRRIDPSRVRGYDRCAQTHSEAAALLAAGKADVALGLQAAAHARALGFIPLFEERYDLVLPRALEKLLTPILEYLHTADFRSELKALTGYNAAHSGEQIPL